MRLFVAVNLPSEVRAAAWAATAPLRAAGLPVRWVPEEGLHLTVKFLGEVADARAEAVGAALAGTVSAVQPFTLGLGGFGAFPSAERPRVLWLGVEHHPALELLADDVERALEPLGFAPEFRPFRPHLTIGRAEKRARRPAFTGLAALLLEAEYAGVVEVGSVELMRSTLGRSGPVYGIQHRAVLGAGR